MGMTQAAIPYQIGLAIIKVGAVWQSSQCDGCGHVTIQQLVYLSPTLSTSCEPGSFPPPNRSIVPAPLTPDCKNHGCGVYEFCTTPTPSPIPAWKCRLRLWRQLRLVSSITRGIQFQKAIPMTQPFSWFHLLKHPNRWNRNTSKGLFGRWMSGVE